MLATDTSTAEMPTQRNLQPFLNERASGVLLHVASLPSVYGIGDLGAAAYTLADRLHSAGQRYWQILPLNPSNPTSGESPYFSSSAFAGNPLLIDLEALVDWGYLSKHDLASAEVQETDHIDFDIVRPIKLNALYKAVANFAPENNAEFEQFCEDQGFWLHDYAIFTVIASNEHTAIWSDWPSALRDREPQAINDFETEHAEAIKAQKIIQYWFYKQWFALKAYCNQKGLVIFGDMPIYVSYASADVWANASLFKLDENKRPTHVSGVPPDYFSATGQLWNNPVYDWSALKAQNYEWWIQRMGGLFALFDMVRIDHFRGLVQYWQVPAGEPTAINGTWEDVPTYELFDALIAAHPDFPAVVEDLGLITDDVLAVKQHYGFQGMHILQFAFDNDDASNPHRLENHPERALVYVGTHDNTTLTGWLNEAEDHTHERLNQKLNGYDSTSKEFAVIELAMGSDANIAIITAQDLLKLPSSARINNPATLVGNWRWRLTQAQFEAIPFDQVKTLTEKHKRLSNFLAER